MFFKIGNFIRTIGIMFIAFELLILLFKLFQKNENEFEDLFGNPVGFEYKAMSRKF